MKKRNSLIELYRFLFAMNVLVCHGFYPVDTEHFGPDRISVEFFFVLSGFLFYHLLEHLRKMKTGEALRFVLWTKMKPLFVPMLIGMASNGVLNVMSGYRPVIEVFRYLWYIPAMLITLVVCTLLYKGIRNEKVFWYIMGALCVIATALRFSGNEVLFFFDYIRSTASITLGLLLAKIPQPKKLPTWSRWLLLAPVAIAIFLILYYQRAVYYVEYEALLDLVLYPLLIYITFDIDFHFVPFDILGAWSFGIYAYQCPARLVAYIGVSSRWIPFLLIVALTLTDYFVRILIRKISAKDAPKA